MKKSKIIIAVLIMVIIIGCTTAIISLTKQSTERTNDVLPATAENQTSGTVLDGSTETLETVPDDTERKDPVVNPVNGKKGPFYEFKEWTKPVNIRPEGNYKSLGAITADFFMNGFTEISLESATRDDRFPNAQFTNMEYFFDGSRMQFNFTYGTEDAKSNWELHAEHTGEPKDIANVTIDTIEDRMRPEARFDGLMVSGYWGQSGDRFDYIVLVYAPETGNTYSLHTTDWPFQQPDIFFCDEYYLPDEFITPSDDAVISEFTIKIGENEIKYPFRVGMRFGDWANSEFNTDGWHCAATSNVHILFGDNNYYFFNDDVIRPEMTATVFDQKEIFGAFMFDEPIATERYCESNAYCINSKTPLFISGFMVRSELFPNDNSYAPEKEGLNTNKLAKKLGINDTISIYMDGVSENDAAHMNVYFATHTNDHSIIPSNATEVEFTLSDGMAIAEYKPNNDPSFNRNNPVDVIITYDNEVVYFIWLPEFYG